MVRQKIGRVCFTSVLLTSSPVLGTLQFTFQVINSNRLSGKRLNVKVGCGHVHSVDNADTISTLHWSSHICGFFRLYPFISFFPSWVSFTSILFLVHYQASREVIQLDSGPEIEWK